MKINYNNNKNISVKIKNWHKTIMKRNSADCKIKKVITHQLEKKA